MRYEGSPVIAPPLSKRRMTQLIVAGAPHWNAGRGRRSNKYRIRKWREECCAIIFALVLRKISCSGSRPCMKILRKKRK